MDNFYTSTVYEKGAEVIRMYHTRAMYPQPLVSELRLTPGTEALIGLGFHSC